MNTLDGIALRLFRDGRWQSLPIGHTDHLLDDEIQQMSWADELTTMLANDPHWKRMPHGWARRRSEDVLKTYHASIRELPFPSRIIHLPTDHRGFPVPKFVAWIDGKPDHRVVNPAYMTVAVQKRLCWICGEKMGRYYTSVIGCMCAVNRVISEPPSHRECAEFAVKACPFLARPQAHRREAGMPEDLHEAPGFMLARNPGVSCLWISRAYPTLFRTHAGNDGILFQLGEPSETIWYREGRLATREEVDSAIHDGLPALALAAEQESPEAVAALARKVGEVAAHLPCP